MVRRLIFLCVSYYIGAWLCTAQTANDGDAMIYVHNFGLNVGDEWPIFLDDGRTNQLAPFGTRVQVLARAVGSTAAFEPVRAQFQNSYSLTTFEVLPRDPGLFDAGPGVIAGLPGERPAEFIARAWLGTATWDEALTNAFAFVGHTPIFTNRTGVWRFSPDSTNPTVLTNAPAFTMYPFPKACGLVPFVGPRPLCMDVNANGQTLAFTWADLGTNYVYTLEFKPSLTATNWTPVPGTTWPARTNQFILPNPPAVPSFYRVRAQLAQ
jgi:hypothetical protein